jgi:predicted ATPase/DNA-binding SARP family transcriptional activator
MSRTQGSNADAPARHLLRRRGDSYSLRMQVRDLGTLEVEVDGGEQSPGGRRPAALLAVLTISLNERVSVDRLCDAVWDGDPPAGAASTLESHIWRLRRVLEPDRATRAAPRVLISDAGGYRLVAEPDDVDSRRFERLAQAAADATRDGSFERVLDLAAEAETLWRGRPYEPFSDAAWAAPTVTRLIELHADLAETRNDAWLETDRPEAALADLEERLIEQPYRERLWAQRMRALFRLGRSQEALHTYQQARRLLVDEVGVNPGQELQDWHRRILQQDVDAPSYGSIHATHARSVEATPRPSIEIHLPSRLTPLLGREAELTALSDRLRQDRLITITGPAGCGKTRLAVEVARSAIEWCDDGIWFVDLSTIDTPEAVAEVIVSAIGFESVPGLEPATALRGYLDGKTLLLVLDNCEHVLPGVTHIAEEILTSGATDMHGVHVLATSREPLDIAGEVIWTLDPLALPEPAPEPGTSPAAALALFIARVNAADPSFRFDADALRVAADICVSLDGLPLALELAAARARSFSLEEILDQVRSDPSRLASIGADASRPRVSLLAAIESSHRLLEPAEQILHRRLAVLPGPFSLATAAAVAGADLTGQADVSDVLTMLVHRSMLEASRSTRRPATTLFRQLSPVRAHAAHELERSGEQPTMVSRRNAAVARLADQRPLLGHSGDAAWYDELDDSYATVRAVLQSDLENARTPAGIRLAAQLAPFWFHRVRLVEGVRWLRLAVEHGLADGDRIDIGLCRTSLAAALSLQGGSVVARPLVDGALIDLTDAPPDRILDISFQLAIIARTLWNRGELEVVGALADLVAHFAQTVPDPEIVLIYDALRCVLEGPGQDPADAEPRAEQIYERGMASENLLAAWLGAGVRIIVAFIHGQTADGRLWIDRSHDLRIALGDNNATQYLEARGNLAALSDEPAQAARLFAAAERESVRAGMQWPISAVTVQRLADVRAALSADRFEHEWTVGRGLAEADAVELP